MVMSLSPPRHPRDLPENGMRGRPMSPPRHIPSYRNRSRSPMDSFRNDRRRYSPRRMHRSRSPMRRPDYSPRHRSPPPMSRRDPRYHGGNGARPGSSSDKPRTLFVGNIPYHFKEDHVRDEFGRFGRIYDITLPMDRSLGHNKGIAFIEYEERRDAEEAMYRMRGVRFDGRNIRLDWEYGTGRKNMDPRSRPRSRSRSRSRGPRRSPSPRLRSLSRSPHRR